MKSRILVFLLPVVMAWISLLSAQQYEGIDELEVEFTNASVRLSGTVLQPQFGTPLAAVVLIHGSGEGRRDGLREIANGLAARNLAVLLYDKRGSGESDGDWTRSSLDTLAEDAAAGFRFLQDHLNDPEIPIGLWGISQGGWIAPVTAQLIEPDFLIVVTGGARSPREVELHGYRETLRSIGASAKDVEVAEQLLSRYFKYLAGSATHESLMELVRSQVDQDWFIALGIGSVIPSPENRQYWEWVSLFESEASVRNLTVPTLVLLGSEDPLAPHPATRNAWEDYLSSAVDQNRVEIFEGAGHGIRTGAHGGDFMPGYFDVQLQWLEQIRAQ